MSRLDPLQLPPVLQARIMAAGVNSPDQLLAAVEKDPELREEFQRFLVSRESEIFELVLQDVLAASDSRALADLATRSPFILEEAFLGQIALLAERAQEQGEDRAAEALEQRLIALHQLRLLRVDGDEDDGDEEADKNEQAEGEPATPPSPIYDAVAAFLAAKTDSAARWIFQQRRSQLVTEEAWRMLSDDVQPENEKSQQWLQNRLTLLADLKSK